MMLTSQCETAAWIATLIMFSKVASTGCLPGSSYKSQWRKCWSM